MTCAKNHVLESLGTSKDNGWGCDGRLQPGGCRSGLTGFHQSQGLRRFRCEACDFDFCEECYLEQLNSRRCTKGHVLVSLGTSLDNGWFCDATKEGGCRSKECGFKDTKGLPRFRCESCDYDLCERCYTSPAAVKGCEKGHKLRGLGLTRDNGWCCDGNKLFGECKRGMKGYKKSKGIFRFRCEVCDFDLCDKCHEARPPLESKAMERREGPLKATNMEVHASLIPEYWDKSILEDIEMGNGLSPTEEGTLNKFAKIPLNEKEIDAIQKLFDSTHKKVYTRDRKGAKVPDGFEVVRVDRIQNLQNWAEFRLRQQEILEEIEKLKEKGEKGVCANGHELEPLGTSEDNGWGCDARSDGGCLSGITGFHQTKGMNRFRCDRCDFDYCEKCYILRTGAKLCLKGHPLTPLGTTKDNGWFCDNKRTKQGCLRDSKTKGVDRYRCEQCDYDLCDLCYQKHIGHVLNNLKTDQMDMHSHEDDKDSNTVWLFHGTSSEAAELITRGDFLVDKAGSNADFCWADPYIAILHGRYPSLPGRAGKHFVQRRCKSKPGLLIAADPRQAIPQSSR
ncbi:unnamed protein product [Durusdinium trenchii]|uniref:Uncharacterized protein n=1 Tax=Durusdinium trenchii TaxID=1381693 RepID=A0ABP0M3T4_9DINO